MRFRLFLVVLVGTLVFLAAANALAQPASQTQPGGSTDAAPSEAEIKRHVEKQVEAERQLRERRRTPEGQETLRRSARAYRGRDRGEARRVLEEHFPVFARPALRKPLRVRPGERVAEFLDDRAVVVERPDGARSLMVGSYPLRTDRGDLVDLTLERDDGVIRPRDPLTPTVLPEQLEQGIRLGSGVRLRLIGGQAEAGDLSDNRATYFNALTDTDVIFAPRVGGFAFFVQVRSADAPRIMEWEFDLPAGAQLRERPRPLPGVEVVRGDERLATLGAPSAYDADGLRIPASFELEGDRVRLRVEHAEGETAYPGVVDPVWEEQPNWQNWSIDQNGWEWTSQSSWCGGSNFIGSRNESYQDRWGRNWERGLYTIFNGWGCDGQTGMWYFRAPRDSWIAETMFMEMQLENHAVYDRRSCSQVNMHSSSGAEVGRDHWTGCHNFWDQTKTVYSDRHLGNRAIFKTWMVGTSERSLSISHLNGANSRLEDDLTPTFDNLGAVRHRYNGIDGLPGGWLKDGDLEAIATPRDRGLGLRHLFVEDHQGQHIWRDGNASYCEGPGWLENDGDRNHRCPLEKVGHVFKYPVSGLPEGSRTLRAVAFDVVGNNERSQTWPVKIDRSAPSSASLTSDAFEPANAEKRVYDVAASATDAHSGVRSLELRVDGQPIPEGKRELACSAQTGCQQTLGHTFRLDTSGYSPNTRHKVELLATDPLGHTKTETRFFDLGDETAPELKVEGGLRSSPVGTGRSLTATATDAEAGVDDLRVFVKPTEAFEPDNVAPVDTDRVHAATCTQDCSRFVTSYALPHDRRSGRYQFTVQARDKAGHRTEERWVTQIVQTRSGKREKLGLEQWFELDDTDPGAEQSLYVNGETGNLVWHATPIVNPGRGLSTVVNLSYNSQERGGLLGADLGRLPVLGANPDDDSVLGDDLTGLAYREAGIGVSLAVGGPTRVNEPLGGAVPAAAIERTQASHDSPWPDAPVQSQLLTANGLAPRQTTESRVSLTDADGTQHNFTRRPGDTAWRAPAGVDLRLRYVGARGPGPLGPLSALVLRDDRAWELLRPDGTRHVFDSFGYQRSTEDRNGNALTYVYKSRSAVDGRECADSDPVARLNADLGLCLPQLQEVRQPTWGGDDPATSEDESARRIKLTYTAPTGTAVDLVKTLNLPEGTLLAAPYVSGGAPRIDTITDASGREYDLDYTAEGHLGEVRENDHAAGGGEGEIRTTRLKYDEPLSAGESKPRMGDVQQLTRVVPVVGGEERAGTTVQYRPRVNPDAVRPPAPRAVAKLTKRDGSPKLFRYGANTHSVFERTLGQRYLTRDTTLDANGRPTRVVERTTELTGEEEGVEPQAVAGQGQTVTELEWSDEENKPATVREAVGTPEQRTTSYTYRPGGAGALTKRTVTAGAETKESTLAYHEGREDGFVADPSSITTPGGRTTTYEDDGRGNITATTNPNGVRTQTEYDATNGFVVTGQQDEMGRWTRHADFDGTGQPQTVTLPGDAGTPARVWRYRYDLRGDLVKVVDPRGETGRTGADDPFVTTLTYDPFSRLERERLPRDSGPDHTDQDGQRFVERSRRFDRDGNATEITDPRGQVTRVEYDAMGQAVAVRAPASADNQTETSRYVYDDAQRPIAQVGPLGAAQADTQAIRSEQHAACEQDGGQGGHAYTTRHCLDHRGRPLASAEYSTKPGDIAARIASFAYDGRGNLIGQNDPNRNSARAADGAQQPVAIAEAVRRAQSTDTRRASFGYDIEDRRTVESERPAEPGEPARTRRMLHDAAGDLVQVTEEGAGRPDRVTRMDYDQMGRMLSSVDPLGRMTCWKRQADGLPTAITSPRGTQTSTQEQCAAGQAYGAHTTTFAYDAVGNLARRSVPYAEDQYGPGRSDVRGWHVAYRRDVVGNPLEMTDARGNKIQNRFYDSGQLRSTDRPSFWQVDWSGQGNPDAGEQFRGQGDAGDVEAGENGPIVREREGPSANAERSGDQPEKPDTLGKGDFGEPERQELPEWLPQAGATTLRYDPEMRLAEVEDADGYERRVGYDAAGRVREKSWPIDRRGSDPATEPRRARHTFAYDLGGKLTSVTEDWQAGNAVQTRYEYDGYDRRVLENAEGANATSPDAEPVREVTRFAFDANDNVVGRTTPRDTRFAYSYDSLDQLTSEANPEGETWRYGYTRFGEREREIAPHDPAVPAAQYTATQTYDNAGQLTRVEHGSDPEDLVWTFEYDADGNREQTTSPGAPHLTNTRVEHDGRGLPWRTTVSGRGVDPRITITEHDANGNLRRQVKPAGVNPDTALPYNADDGSSEEGNLESASRDAMVGVFDADDLQVAQRLPWRDKEGDPKDGRYVIDTQRDGAQKWISAITLPHAVGSDSVYRTGYTQNAAGWTTEITDQHRASVTDTDGVERDAKLRFTYDEQGNQTTWRSEHARKDDRGRDMRFAYWPNGLLKRRKAVKTVEDGEDTQRTYDYLHNANGSLARVVDHDSTRLSSDRDDGAQRTTVYARDSAERETRVDEQWKGGKDVEYAYEQHTGLLAQRKTDGRFASDGGAYGTEDTKTTTFEYDRLGRETKMTVDPFRGDERDVRTTTTEWNPGGQMAERKKPNDTVDRWSWNALGEKEKHERIRKGQSSDESPVKYEYDRNGNREVDERGEHEFNARDQLVSWKRSGSGVRGDRKNWTTSYKLEPTGAIGEKVERDELGIEKVRTKFDYNGERLEESFTTDTTKPLAKLTSRQSYRYDDAGNVQRVYSNQEATATGATEIVLADPSKGDTALDPEACKADDSDASTEVTRYCYDEFNRQTFSAGAGVDDPAEVTYDGLDRRDRKKVRNSETSTDAERRDYGYLGSSELLSTEGVSKTGADGTSSSKRHSYDYDSQGDRQGQQTDEDEGTELKTRYSAYAKDANGSVIGLEQGDGTFAEGEQYSYDPYGELDLQPRAEPLPTSGSEPTKPEDQDTELGLSEAAKDNPFRFEGFYFDSGVKTYDMHARHYRPENARFLSRDQYASAAGDQALQADPLTQDRYGFAGANPTTNVEFDGHYNCGPSIENGPCATRGPKERAAADRRDRRAYNRHKASAGGGGPRPIRNGRVAPAPATVTRPEPTGPGGQGVRPVTRPAPPPPKRIAPPNLARNKNLWDAFKNDAGGTFKAALGSDFGVGRPESAAYKREAGDLVNQAAGFAFGPGKLKAADKVADGARGLAGGAGRRLTDGERVGIVREAFQRKGNYGLGRASRSDADGLGMDFVGPGFTRSRRDPGILISQDGLRQYRPPSYKPNLGRTQANFERRFEPGGRFNANGHLDIDP